MTVWVDWDRVPLLKETFSFKVWKNLIILGTIMMLLVVVDVYLNMSYIFNFHYVPEVGMAFVLGSMLYKAGLREWFVCFLITSSFIINMIILGLLATVNALPLFVAIYLFAIAGFYRTKKKDINGRKI